MRRSYAPVLIVVALVVSAIVYPQLPERMPHWDMRGNVDGYGSKLAGAFLLPLAALGIWAFLQVAPRIDPRKQNYDKFRPTYDLMVNAVVTMAVAVHFVLLGVALGLPIPMRRILPAGAGVLFILLGNVLPRSRSNWWFGIRTPWTLSNERVWERTHRVGGYLFAIAGVVFVAGAFVPRIIPPSTIPIGLAVLGGSLLIYSYVAWRQETSR
jgi:uncharacterized membrane protein